LGAEGDIVHLNSKETQLEPSAKNDKRQRNEQSHKHRHGIEHTSVVFLNLVGTNQSCPYPASLICETSLAHHTSGLARI
jgi:hypothetical protein